MRMTHLYFFVENTHIHIHFKGNQHTSMNTHHIAGHSKQFILGSHIPANDCLQFITIQLFTFHIFAKFNTFATHVRVPRCSDIIQVTKQNAFIHDLIQDDMSVSWHHLITIPRSNRYFPSLHITCILHYIT